MHVHVSSVGFCRGSRVNCRGSRVNCRGSRVKVEGRKNARKNVEGREKKDQLTEITSSRLLKKIFIEY